MLQIASGMYFRAGVELNETTHRAVMYTNAWSVNRDAVDLPMGRFTFATSMTPVAAVMIEVVDRLEATRPDGSRELMVATGGTELIDDAAAVFSFALNVSCSRNAASIERLVPAQLDGRPTRMPWSILRRTFDPAVALRDEDFDAARDFAVRLLALRRDHFQAAIRAVRSVVDATLLVSDDPGLAYTLFVASLESLAQLSIPVEETRDWSNYDSRRRRIFDRALDASGVSHEQAVTLRDAVLEIDQLSLRRRFIDFTLAHVGPAYYRREATDAVRPIRATDLPNALAIAYRLRSQNVHLLEALAPELWAITDRADTLRWDARPVLSLEGLNRLCHHVIRAFVERGPTDLDTTFDFRRHLPGIVRVQIAPQYWIWQAEGFTVDLAPRVLEGFIDLLIETMSNPDDPTVVDLSAVLEKIETSLPATAQVEARQPMVAIYDLWHTVMNPVHHRPRAEPMLQRFRSDLDGPSLVGFAVRVLTGRDLEWDLEEQLRLVEARRDDLRRGRGQPLPARLDAALLIAVAQNAWNAGRRADASTLITEAVNSLPGTEELIAIEELFARGEPPMVDLLDFVIARSSGEETGEFDGDESTSGPGANADADD